MQANSLLKSFIVKVQLWKGVGEAHMDSGLICTPLYCSLLFYLSNTRYVMHSLWVTHIKLAHHNKKKIVDLPVARYSPGQQISVSNQKSRTAFESWSENQFFPHMKKYKEDKGNMDIWCKRLHYLGRLGWDSPSSTIAIFSTSRTFHCNGQRLWGSK